jgi:hypothetical protein
MTPLSGILIRDWNASNRVLPGRSPAPDQPIGIGGDAAALEEDMLDVDLDRSLNGEDLQAGHLEGQLGGTSRPFEWPIQRKRKSAARSELPIE